ncbi:MAG: YbbR-like domain-containing protein [Porcipelethomonas sp.]
MKLFRNIKNNILNSLNNNLAIVIYAVIVSIILWFVISITIYPTTPKTFSNVPIDIDITGTSAESNGLSVIKSSADKVNVTIKGNRSSIGNLKAEDLTARAVVENVNSAGEKNLKINVTCKDSGVNFEVTEIKPSTVTVMFDKISTIEFDVDVEAPNITAAENLDIDKEDFKCTPPVMEITGPSTQLDNIQKVSVLVDNKQTLDSAYTFHSSNVILYDKNDSKIDSSDITFDTTDFTIDIPVYMKRELALGYDIKYAPSNFDISSIGLEMNVESIILASPNTEIEKLDSWNVGSIPLYDIDLDFNKQFEIEVPENYKNLSNISNVNVTLNTDGLAKKTVTVNDITVVNAPSDYDCTVNTYGLVFDIIGPEEDIEQITEKDIIVTVDLLKYNIQSSNFTADATISFPNYNKVWAVGLQKVSVSAEKTTQTIGE